MAAILSALSTIVSLFRMFRDIFALYNQARAEGWLEDALKALDRVKEAKTDEERKALARELARVGMFPRN